MAARMSSSASSAALRERGSSVPCQRDPVPLAVTLAELLELSDERDQWMRRLGAEYRLGYAIGHALGVDEGRRLEAAEMAKAWNRIARTVTGGVTHAELEARRWGPVGRAHFGDPQPGDRFGQQEGAA
jgi:hypothetical protein